MSVFAWKLGIAVILGTSFAVLSMLLGFAMIGEINRKVPGSESISYLRWSWRVMGKYKQLYPHGGLAKWAWFCEVMKFASFVYGVLVLLGVA